MLTITKIHIIMNDDTYKRGKIMLKKSVIISAIFLSSMNVAFANTGPYIGGSLGAETGSYSGLAATLFGGYGATFSGRYYLGGELFADTTADLDAFNKKTTSLGFSILPGVMLSDTTLAYLRAGLVRSHFVNQSFLGSERSSATSTGKQAGLGLQTNFAKQWDVRGEYTYTKYNSLAGVSAPHTNQFNVGVIYKFN